MQREVADRFAAGPNDPDYGALSVESQYLYETRKLVNVPRSSFYPAPNVDSAVIVFTRRAKEDPDIDRNAFFDFVKACFKQRRKTLYNNLKEYCGSGEKAMSVLETAGIGAGQRAQELDVDDFLRLFRSTL